MNQNLVGSVYGTSSIKIANFIPPFSIFSLAAILVGSRDHRTQFWKGAIQGPFHQSLVQIGPVAVPNPLVSVGSPTMSVSSIMPEPSGAGARVGGLADPVPSRPKVGIPTLSTVTHWEGIERTQEPDLLAEEETLPLLDHHLPCPEAKHQLLKERTQQYPEHVKHYSLGLVNRLLSPCMLLTPPLGEELFLFLLFQ
jgi:hypothetical protein